MTQEEIEKLVANNETRIVHSYPGNNGIKPYKPGHNIHVYHRDEKDEGSVCMLIFDGGRFRKKYSQTVAIYSTWQEAVATAIKNSSNAYYVLADDNSIKVQLSDYTVYVAKLNSGSGILFEPDDDN